MAPQDSNGVVMGVEGVGFVWVVVVLVGMIMVAAIILVVMVVVFEGIAF